MAYNGWNIVSYPSTAAAASASRAAPTTQAGDIIRLRSLTLGVAANGAASGNIKFVVRDGATGAGTIIWETVLAAPDGGSNSIFLTGLDLRASLGNALTVESTGAGAAGSQISISASGDQIATSYMNFAT